MKWLIVGNFCKIPPTSPPRYIGRSNMYDARTYCIKAIDKYLKKNPKKYLPHLLLLFFHLYFSFFFFPYFMIFFDSKYRFVTLY